MLQCIFRLCVRVLKLGYNGVQRVGGVFGVVFGGGGQFFSRRRRRRRGSCFFFVFVGRLLGVAFLDTWRNHCVEYFLLLLLLINKVSPRRFLFLLFGDECRRRRPRRCVSRFHPLSFCLSLSVCLSLSLCLVRAMT